jgi:hypothetical protein
MIELIILVLILYIGIKLAWWLVKTAFFVSLVAFIGVFFWVFFLV